MPVILCIRARSLALLFACVVALPLSCLGSPPQELPALNVDIAQTSLSGISSGAFMAVQFEIAHSSIVKGVGVVAGGPYFCSQGSAIGATTRCSCTLDPAHLVCGVSATSADVPALENATRSFAADHLIDSPSHLAGQRVFILAGGRDPIVPAAMAAQTADYYRRFSVPANDISTRIAGQRRPHDADGELRPRLLRHRFALHRQVRLRWREGDPELDLWVRSSRGARVR